MDSIALWKPSEVKSMMRLADRVAVLQDDIPTRDGGMPLGYVNSVELVRLSPSEDPSLAMVPISYMEGFPTVDGVPIWERLENEPAELFELFRAYRDMPATEGRRKLSVVASRKGADIKAISAVAKLWHWAPRSNCFDLFREMEREAIRRYEIRKMENDHAAAADRLFITGNEFFVKHAAEITPKVALDMIKLSVELKRLSLGLAKDKPEGYQDTQGGVTINMPPSTGGAPSIGTPSAKEDKSRIFEILAVLKQTGVLDVKDIVEGEVIDVDGSGSVTAAEADHNSEDHEVHGGGGNPETNGLSLA